MVCSGAASCVSNGCIHMLRSVAGDVSACRLKGLIVSGDTVATGSGAIEGRREGAAMYGFLIGGGGMKPSIEVDDERFFALL